MSLKTWGTGAVLSLVLGVAHALPAVSLSFAQPDGVVGPTDEIPVQLLPQPQAFTLIKRL